MDLKNSHAGTLESGDILIEIAPAETPGIEISLESTVAYQFGDQIKNVIKDTAEELGLKSAKIHAVDKGALDCTIKARTTAAVVRATGVDVWKD